MKNKYICTGWTKEGEQIAEILTTETSRSSKVIKVINEAFVKKYGKKFTDLQDAYVGKLPKNFKHEQKKLSKTDSTS